jgi:UDP-glucose 4-epimerase
MSGQDAPRRVVAITGTSEFLGSRLIGRLERSPEFRRILAIDVREPISFGRKTEFFPVDLTAPEAGPELAALLRRNRVDVLVHLAFLSHPIHDTTYAHELQVIGTMHTLHAAAAARVKKVVLQGDTMVYGARPDNPNFLQEDRPLRPLPGCPIVNDLVEVENQLQKFSRKHPKVVTTVLRFGYRLGPNVDGLLVRLLRRSTVPTVMGCDPLMQFLHEQDALDALTLAVERDHPGVYNIVADGVVPLSTALRMGGRLTVPIPHCLWERVGTLLWAFQAMDMPISFLDFLRFLWVADGDKARREMGFVPRYSTRETLMEFFRRGSASPAPVMP